ncbi:ABC transporter ATP-binding protein [Virgibacillus halophilus]|uniref:ABC transporter ATP-binding protein n=1 Tax=Tigheibacillus halophilus TaxID=361280 RepID=A0ABU5C988_9BACI|nr:ABC transporter ATP-binding protein [Virgibacillus halophilus]
MKIVVKGLTRKYGEKLALNNVSFTLDEPKIYGLLGRNGAGKTTFMEILSGYKLASSGQILVDDEDPFDNQRLTESICLIKDTNNFKPELKVKHILRMYSYFYPTWDAALAEELIDVYQLNRNSKVKALSKGMESALGIIVGLASKAPITIFDEPYVGLDASARKKFYEILMEEYEAKKTNHYFINTFNR